jgi:hypothetical protein
MAKVDFKSLSPEEVAALSGKEKANYDKWLAKQNDSDPSNDNDEPEEETAVKPDAEILLVEVEPVIQVNTSVFGNLYPGKKYKIASDLAQQLEEQKQVVIVA